MSSLQPDGDRWRTIHQCALRVYVPISDPHVASVSRVWRTADWHEREGYDSTASCSTDTTICAAYFCRTTGRDILCAGLQGPDYYNG